MRVNEEINEYLEQQSWYQEIKPQLQKVLDKSPYAREWLSKEDIFSIIYRVISIKTFVDPIYNVDLWKERDKAYLKWLSSTIGITEAYQLKDMMRFAAMVKENNQDGFIKGLFDE